MSAALEGAYRAMERSRATDDLAERIAYLREARGFYAACVMQSRDVDEAKRHMDNVAMVADAIAYLERLIALRAARGTK